MELYTNAQRAYVTAFSLLTLAFTSLVGILLALCALEFYIAAWTWAMVCVAGWGRYSHQTVRLRYYYHKERS